MMKKFTLGCEQNHEFEGWFADAESIRQQISQGLLDCPYCGSTQLEKRLSAPHLSTPKTKARIAAQQHNAPAADPAGAPPAATPPATAPSSAPASGQTTLSPPAGDGAAALRMAVRALQQKIKTEFTDVGDKFADEARKMHDGDTEQQNIYGTCTPDEQRELAEDGIEVLPLPDLPPEH